MSGCIWLSFSAKVKTRRARQPQTRLTAKIVEGAANWKTADLQTWMLWQACLQQRLM